MNIIILVVGVIAGTCICETTKDGVTVVVTKDGGIVDIAGATYSVDVVANVVVEEVVVVVVGVVVGLVLALKG